MFHADATRLERVGKGSVRGAHMELPGMAGSSDESHETLLVCALSVLGFEPGTS